MRVFRISMRYLRERQPPLVLFLHLTIICMVISQLVVSNFMGFTAAGAISRNAVEHYGTWMHILTGLLLLPIALVFVTAELSRHGFAYFFPYLKGDFAQISKDIGLLKRIELPPPSAGGLATVVEGLGMGALMLVLLSGCSWFLSWLFVPAWAHAVKELHETLTGLIEAYVIGHGAMGLLHLFLEFRHEFHMDKRP